MTCFSATDLYQIAEYLLLVSPRQADAKNESNDALVEENEADKNYGRYDDVHYLAEMIVSVLTEIFFSLWWSLIGAGVPICFPRRSEFF